MQQTNLKLADKAEDLLHNIHKCSEWSEGQKIAMAYKYPKLYKKKNNLNKLHKCSSSYIHKNQGNV